MIRRRFDQPPRPPLVATVATMLRHWRLEQAGSAAAARPVWETAAGSYRDLARRVAAAFWPRPVSGVHLGVIALVTVLVEALTLAGPPAGSWLTGPAWAAVRIPLGLVALLVLPGHALATVVFPRASDLDGFERVALAVGLSVAQIPILALILDRSVWGLSPVALVVALGTLTRLWCLVAALRLGQVPAGERFRLDHSADHSMDRRRELFSWPNMGRWERGAVVASAGLLVAVVWSLAVVTSRPALPPLTEFYMLGADGLAEAYPRSVAPGEPIEVTVGLINHERRPVEYRVVARHGNVILAETVPFQVEAGAAWRDRLTFALPEYGFGQRPEILLFRAEDPVPYRRLHLVIDVPPPGVPTPVRPFATPVSERGPVG